MFSYEHNGPMENTADDVDRARALARTHGPGTSTPDPWETTRHVLPPDLAAELHCARLRRGLGLREAARQVGIRPGYLTLLEQGKRCPSVAVAHELAMALALELSPDDRAWLMSVARPDAGRSWHGTR